MYLAAVLFLPAILLAQGGPWTTPPNTNGKVRIVSTAADALGVGCSGSAPTASSCGGGIYAGALNVLGTIKATTTSAFAPTGTFRNLYFRTHPDNDVAASKVMLVHADEIITDDGARFTNVDRLVADVTVSGAGGLDTGAEAASTWYETYFTAKEDGTQNLLLHRSKDYFKDTSFVTAVDASRGLRRATATATDKLGQSFQLPTTTGKVEFVDAAIGTATAPSGNSWLTIEADSAGNPSGTPLATSDKFNANTLPSAAAYVRAIFRNPATLNSGATYWLVYQGDYTRSDTVNDIWRGVAAGGYASGSAKEFNGTTWSAATGVGDFDFSIYVTRNDATVTMPTDYTKKAVIGYVYNTAGSNFFAFAQQDHSTQHARTVVTSALTATTTAPVILDLSTFMPPGVRRIKGQVSNATANEAVLMSGVPEYAQVSNTQAIHSGGVGLIGSYWPITTETQAMYVTVSGGTGTVYASGFEW